ncbi:MAG: hypothetical protein HeimC2_02190 [Candidatus Heimdallarchaeota archaeon LC_2]|nr:MAG: hypothetical protein HeimC2_02190 [Candidatus Heimdallarchaeota archaeon LC_2]
MNTSNTETIDNSSNSIYSKMKNKFNIHKPGIWKGFCITCASTLGIVMALTVGTVLVYYTLFYLDWLGR